MSLTGWWGEEREEEEQEEVEKSCSLVSLQDAASVAQILRLLSLKTRRLRHLNRRSQTDTRFLNVFSASWVFIVALWQSESNMSKITIKKNCSLKVFPLDGVTLISHGQINEFT